MNKTQTALTSLVAAIPAAFLAYLLVMALTGGGLSGMLMAVVGLTLLVAVATALTPVGIVLMWPKSPEERAAKAAGEDDVAVVSESEVEVAESADDVEVAESEDEFEIGDDEEFADEDEPPKKKRR